MNEAMRTQRRSNGSAQLPQLLIRQLSQAGRSLRDIRTSLPPGLFLIAAGLASAAGILTVICYFAANSYFTARIDAEYDNFVLEELAAEKSDQLGVRNLATAAEVSLDGEPQWLVDHVQMQLRERLPAHQQLLQLIMGSVETDADEARSQLLREMITGNRRWSVIGTVSAQATTGKQVFQKQEELADSALRKSLDAQNGGAERRKLGIFLSRRLVDAVHAEIRNLRRINGPIQWLTVYLFWLVLLIIAGRCAAVLLLRNPAPRAVSNAQFLQAATRCFPRHQIELLVKYLLGAMPSLGFVGTIWGMGAALLQADKLIGAVDQEQALRTMTEHLGYAFDTTLVALIAAMVAGAAFVSLKVYESSLNGSASLAADESSAEGEP